MAFFPGHCPQVAPTEPMRDSTKTNSLSADVPFVEPAQEQHDAPDACLTRALYLARYRLAHHASHDGNDLAAP
jgi:hypothetical protein